MGRGSAGLGGAVSELLERFGPDAAALVAEVVDRAGERWEAQTPPPPTPQENALAILRSAVELIRPRPAE